MKKVYLFVLFSQLLSGSVFHQCTHTLWSRGLSQAFRRPRVFDVPKMVYAHNLTIVASTLPNRPNRQRAFAGSALTKSNVSAGFSSRKAIDKARLFWGLQLDKWRQGRKELGATFNNKKEVFSEGCSDALKKLQDEKKRLIAKFMPNDVVGEDVSNSLVCHKDSHIATDPNLNGGLSGGYVPLFGKRKPGNKFFAKESQYTVGRFVFGSTTLAALFAYMGTYLGAKKMEYDHLEKMERIKIGAQSKRNEPLAVANEVLSQES